MADYVSVCGILRSRSEVEKTIDILREESFRSPDISISVGAVPGDDVVEKLRSSSIDYSSSKLSTAGGMRGWLAGVVATVVPSVSILEDNLSKSSSAPQKSLATGPVMPWDHDFLSVRHPLIHYQTAVESGGILLAVNAPSGARAEIAQEVLEDAGAQFISILRKTSVPSQHIAFEHHEQAATV